MAAKTVVCLSYLFALLIINIVACSGYRAAPERPSETTPGGPGKWSANKGNLGMTEEASGDMNQNGHDGAAFGRQGVDGSSLGASINGAGIGFGSGGGVGIGGSGGIGIGGGSGGGIGLGGSSREGRSDQSPMPEHPTIPYLPYPPAGTYQPIRKPDPFFEPKYPGSPDIGMGGSPDIGMGGSPDIGMGGSPDIGTGGLPDIGMGGGGGGGGGIGIGDLQFLLSNKAIGQLTGFRCHPNVYCVTSTMYFGGSSISDEDAMNKNGIHHITTVMSSDPDNVHDHIVKMISMEGNKNAKNAGESESKHSQTMTSNMGSKTGLAMERIHD